MSKEICLSSCRLLLHSVLSPIEQDLTRLGNDLNGSMYSSSYIIYLLLNMSIEIRSIGQLADVGPSLTQYDQWGRRVDIIHTSEGWRKLKSLAAEEGIVGIAYDRQFGEYSRLYMFSKSLILNGEGRVVCSGSTSNTILMRVQVLCPISMTDGCSRGKEYF